MRLYNLKKMLSFLMLVLIFSCKKDRIIKNYYKNGNISEIFTVDKNDLIVGNYKMFYENGNLKESRFYKKGEIFDTIKYFDIEGKIKGGSFKTGDSIYTYNLFKGEKIKEGMNKRSSQIGDSIFNGWINYYKDNKINKKVFYKYVEGKGTLINGYYEYDESNNIIDNKSYSFKLILPDTLTKGKSYEIEILFNSNAIRTVGYFTVASDKISDSFKNLHQIKLDTIYNEQKPKFLYKPSKNGNTVLRGKFTEQFLSAIDNVKDSSKYDVTVNYRDFYFEKKIYIKSDSTPSN